MGLFDFLFGKPKTQTNTNSHPTLLGEAKRARSSEAAILDVKVGDVISYNTVDYIVKNRQVYNSHGFEWFSFHLVDSISGQALWIDAEDDDELEISISQTIKLALELPLPQKLRYENREYFLDEHGQAKVRIESMDSGPRQSQVEYWDYADQSEEYYLGVERWGDELEASLSQSIEAYELTILGGAEHV